jgi:carbon monoxide dehydrogenase subunit G
MVSIEAKESLARSAAEVFAFIADVRNDRRWHTDILEARLIEGISVDKGTTFEIKTKPFMGVAGGTVTVSEYEPPNRIRFEVRMGTLGATTTFEVVPEGEGCLVTRRVEIESQGLMRAMAPFLSAMMRKRNAQFLANLRRVLETDGMSSARGGGSDGDDPLRRTSSTPKRRA